MIIERDVSVEMDDGVELRADVYRPDTEVPVPVIMSMGPYGKGVTWQDHHYKASWDWMASHHQDMLPGSNREFLAWETVDPEVWVAWGYAVVRADSRGAGRSPGRQDIFSEREAWDYYHLIEWAGTSAWSNGKVGLCGISYFAMNQWRVAALQPPHLSAMIPWEGATDGYREVFRHGGILSNRFQQTWYPNQVLLLQHGNPSAPQDDWLDDPASGPDAFSKEQLAANRLAPLDNARAREMESRWYESRSADLTKVVTPFLSATNWAGFGLHSRGNFEAFTLASSKEKWLECHPGKHEEFFYLDYGLDMQKRFMDHFLKEEDNGWSSEPRVLLNIRRPFTDEVELRREDEWPLADTRWTPLFLDAAETALSWEQPDRSGEATFDAGKTGLSWLAPPLEAETEFTGPVALKLFISSTTEDADLFVTLQAFSPEGREVDFQGTVDPHTPLAQGWLRASHRRLSEEHSLPYRPFHTHEEKEPLVPDQVYELDIEIWPTCIVLPAGFRLALDIRGADFDRRSHVDAASEVALAAYGGSGPWLHNDPIDRPSQVFGGRTTIHTPAESPSFLLMPLISTNCS